MKHYEVVCALIENNKGQIFCLQRGPGRSLEGYWEFPGGKVEKGESHEETIVREIKEELKSIVMPIKYLGESSYTYPETNGYDAFSITLYGYKCKLISGELELTEHKNAKWLTFDEMKNYKFAMADVPFTNKKTN